MDVPQGLPIGPKESFHIVTSRKMDFNLDSLVTRKCTLNTSVDRAWLVEQVRSVEKLPFNIEELSSVVDFVSGILKEDWLTIYPGGMLSLRTADKSLHGLYLFEHLIPLGCGLRLLENKPGFAVLLRKLNCPTYDRLSSLLEVFAAARYAASRYEVELEPGTPEGKHSDFRVRFNDEWIYFECKRINVRENKSVKRNLKFIDQLMNIVVTRFKEKIPNDYRIDIRLDRKPTSVEIETLFGDLEKMIIDGHYELWVEKEFGKYALTPRRNKEPSTGYPSSVTQITVGTTPTPLSSTQAPIRIFFNPLGSKIEQKFRAMLKQSKKQIPSGSRGILVIQGLNEEKASKIMQQQIGHPEYNNIIAGVGIENGAIAVRRDDQTDVDMDFIGKCVSHSLFYGYDIGNT